MNALNALVGRPSVEVPHFVLDRFQEKVLQQLHLEFFLAKCRLVFRPHLSYFTTGEATEAEQAQVRAILEDSQEILEQLKLRLLYDLSLYSALLETNSYHVAVNEHLVISRFLTFGTGPDEYEVKLYTLPPEHLPERYGDRIYLGRDVLRLGSPHRPHLGLAYLRQSLPEQLDKLEARLEKHAPDAERQALRRDFLEDLEELTEEFSHKADAIIGSYPAEMSSATLSPQKLLEVNQAFRELKHVLAEAEAPLREMEEKLFAGGSRAARYVTKLRKDVTNTINYIMLKVNGRISDALNGIHI
jgi:hypothetical protein